MGSRPSDVIPPLDNVVFVANFASNSVSAVDAWTLENIDEIPVGSEPIAIASDTHQNERFIFVSSSGSDTVSMITVNNMKPYRNISVGEDPRGIAVNPIMNRAYTANSGSDSISLIDYLSHKR